MENKQTIHLVDPSSRLRAELASIAYAMGHHAEVYADFDELSQRPLIDGIILVRDDPVLGGVGQFMERLAAEGIWLPVVAFADEIDPDCIVEAMKSGALDYLALPLDRTRLERTLTTIGPEAAAFGAARQKMLDARDRISNLSNREREVLDWLSRGMSNKAIARELDISPRTVEIHRANMMTKLGASHAADAVRMRIEANIDSKVMA